MYETYFGFSSPPFLLNPDPSFFFDSKGHSSALSYLKFGLYQAEGFIVITGDIGAGKTTLVRTLLSDIDTEKVVAAQLVSTQLEAGDLLRSAITAFGIPYKGTSKAELIATLEAYLTLLATQKKRAVLIVDEAQNLSRDAIEELRMLSNFQFGNQALLQSFLIGQPELREMLLSRSLEQLRQRVIASYHLGPMDREETRRYVEHRLKKLAGTASTPNSRTMLSTSCTSGPRARPVGSTCCAIVCCCPPSSPAATRSRQRLWPESPWRFAPRLVRPHPPRSTHPRPSLPQSRGNTTHRCVLLPSHTPRPAHWMRFRP